jgi:hypothetical protein
MLLDKRLLCKHLKRWTFAGLLKTDIVDRGIPWTMLILRDRHIPDDLNLKWTQRWSVPVVFALIVACALIAVRPWIGAPLTAATVALLIYLNRAFYRFLALKRGHRFTVAAIPCHFLYHFYNGISFLAGTAMFLWKRPPPTTSS